jgi:hypothetical protein
MPNTNSLTPADLLALRKKLCDTPAIEYNPWGGERPLTTLEVVAMLKDEITAMRNKGYRVVQIAELLTSNGFNISDSVLYDAMRKLDCSLSRQKVPIAQFLSAHLARAAGAEVGAARSDESVVDYAAKASTQASHKTRKLAPLEAKTKLGPDLVKIQPKARQLLGKLKPTEAVVFKEVLNQLRRGNQLITLDAQTSDAGKIFVEMGLLRPIKQQGEHAYEVPFEIAHVGNNSRRAAAYRGD